MSMCPSFFSAPPSYFLVFLEFISLASRSQQVKGDLSSQEALSHDTSLFIVTLCPMAQPSHTLLRVCFDIKATFQSDICKSDMEALKGLLKTGTKGYRVTKL